MSLFKHRGGSLTVTSTDGKNTKILYYGPGLHKACPTCKVDSHVRCVTNSGALLKGSHQARI